MGQGRGALKNLSFYLLKSIKNDRITSYSHSESGFKTMSRFLTTSLFASCVVFSFASPVYAACVEPVTAPMQTQVDRFKASSADLLTQYPEGGGAMTRDIRNLISADPATLPLVSTLVTSANMLQKSAIGTGLGQAARMCERPDPAFANKIQEAVAATADLGLTSAFLTVTGAIATAATSATSAPAAPSSGPVGNGPATGGRVIDPTGVTNNSGSFPNGSGASGVGSLTRNSNRTITLTTGGNFTTSGFSSISPNSP